MPDKTLLLVNDRLINSKFICRLMFTKIKGVMSKQKKGNKEVKKPKAESNETKKQKKDPKRHDGTISDLFGNPK